MRVSVSCIIPAWNEAERLPFVLAAVVGHPAVDEVIVVDDGSLDDSADVAERLGARVLRLGQNGGKSAAVAAGVRQARGDLILLLDADLVGLTAMQVLDLLVPVRSGRADVAISLRQNAPRLWQWIGLDYISGERVMRRDMVLPLLNRMAGLKGFGLEVFLNRLWMSEQARVAVVRLAAVSPSKVTKQGLLKGISGDIRMMRDILGTIGAVAALQQIVALRRLRVQTGPIPEAVGHVGEV